MSPSRQRSLRLGLAFTSLWIVGLGVFTLYPVGAALFYSFCDYSVLQSPVWCGLENYRQLATDESFQHAVRNTLIYAIGSIPLGMASALGLGLLLNCDLRGRVFFRTLFYLPSIVPMVAASMIWLWMFNGESGLVNWITGPLFRLFGATAPAWLADPFWAKPALILISVWGVGNSMIIYLAGLQDVPRELHEAATLEGANAWQRFRHVTLPLLSPVLYFDLVMGVIGALQVFTQAYIMRGDGGEYLPDGAPAESTLFLTVYLFSTAFFRLRMGYACAMAWILFIVTLACTGLVHRIAGRKVHYSS